MIFEATIVDHIGPRTAESWAGADWVITAEISDSVTTIRKSIMLQSKLGQIAKLDRSSRKKLNDQIEKMRQFTNAPKVMETVEGSDSREPRIVSGIRVLSNKSFRSYRLGGYITGRVLTTLDGDTRPEFVDAVQDSMLTQLKVIARSAE